MYLPSNSTIVGSLMPITTIDVSLHTFLGVSWFILLPYTLFGAALMVYSQGRLLKGQRKLKRQEEQEARD